MIAVRVWPPWSLLVALESCVFASHSKPPHLLGSVPLISVNLFVPIIPLLALADSELPEDLYEVLGVERTVSKEEIKGAYRTLALKWHPDKHPKDKIRAEERFRKIAEAYEVLSNDDSREQYDNFGTTGGDDFQEGPPFEGSFEDFLRSAGFDFGFHEPDEVFAQAINELDVEAIFDTIFDEYNSPVEPEDLQENSAINDLHEAASLGVNFEFSSVKTGADGVTHRRVFRSDGLGGFSAYADPVDDESDHESGTWIDMEGEGAYMHERMMMIDGEDVEMEGMPFSVFEGVDPSMISGMMEGMEDMEDEEEGSEDYMHMHYMEGGEPFDYEEDGQEEFPTHEEL